MADEVASTIVLKMRDEASQKMENFGDTTQTVAMESLQLQVALVAVGGALSAVGGLLGQIDSPAAKTAQTFLMFGGAVFSAAAAIGAMLPVIRSLITSLKALAIVKAIVAALSGPVGWATLGIGLGIAGAATAGIIAMTGGFGGGQARTTNVNIRGGPLLMDDDAAMTRFGRRITEVQDQDKAVGR